MFYSISGIRFSTGSPAYGFYRISGVRRCVVSSDSKSIGSPPSDLLKDLQLHTLCSVPGVIFSRGSPASDFYKISSFTFSKGSPACLGYSIGSPACLRYYRISSSRFFIGSPESDVVKDLWLQTFCSISGFRFSKGSPA